MASMRLPAGVLGFIAAAGAIYRFFKTDDLTTPLPAPPSSLTATPQAANLRLGFSWANATGMHNDQCLTPRTVDKPYDYISAICCFLALTVLSIVYALLATACYTAAQSIVPRLKTFVKQIMPPKLLQTIETTSSIYAVAAVCSNVILNITDLPHNATVYLNGLVLLTSLFFALYEVFSATAPESPVFDAVNYQPGTLHQLVVTIALFRKRATESAIGNASLNKRNVDLVAAIERLREEGRKYKHEFDTLNEKVMTLEVDAANAASALQTLHSDLSVQLQAYTSLEQRLEDSQKLLLEANDRTASLQAEVQKLNVNAANFQPEQSALRTTARKPQNLEDKPSQCPTFTPVCSSPSQDQVPRAPSDGQPDLKTGQKADETNETTSQPVSSIHTTSDAPSPAIRALSSSNISAENSNTKTRDAAPYQPDDKQTGEKYPCKRGSLCLGDPSEYKKGWFIDRPERARRYGGDSSNKEKQNKKTARDVRLCCNCFSESRRLLRESKDKGVDGGKGAMPEWYYD